MKQQNVNYPLQGLEDMEVEKLLALRQQIREVRDNIRVQINEEINAQQAAIRREGINEKRIFDIQLNELKRQMEEIGPAYGAPAGRLKGADIRDKMSELKYKFSIAQDDRETQLAKSATERIRRNAKNQLDYENMEIAICRVIRLKDGFREFGFNNQEVRTANGDIANAPGPED